MSDEDLLRGCCPTEEKAEMQKTCTISHCQELVVVAEQSAWRSLQQHQDAAKEKVTEEEPEYGIYIDCNPLVNIGKSSHLITHFMNVLNPVEA